MAKGFDLDLDFRIKRLRWHWRLWLVEPAAEVEPQRMGDVYASTERRMGFTANTPN